mgnify:CR=1 FL=1
MEHMKKSWEKIIKTILGVLVGNLVLSFAVAAFIVPNGIIMGGATGIGLTISHYFQVNLSMIILAINAVLFVLGAVFLGKKFALTTIISSFIYPIFLSMAQSIPGIDKVTQDNAMLAALYGGVLLGIGIGLVVRVGASTGGTDILALVLHKWFHVPVSGILVYRRFFGAGISDAVFRFGTDTVWYFEFVFKYGCAEPGDASWEVTDPVICNFGQIQRNPSESLNGY